MRKIESALISVYNKEGLEPLLKILSENDVKLYSTGGTQSFIEEKGYQVEAVENITEYPSIFGGRVKTLHPSVFGGILYRRENENDLNEKVEHKIPSIDMVVVDLYPFEDTVTSGASHEDIIEKIDIGGISLIRAAAKNYKDVLIVSSRNLYGKVVEVLQEQNCATSMEQRKVFALNAFDMSSHYDSMIFNYFNKDKESESFKLSIQNNNVLRYGENPHQKGVYYGNLNEVFEILSGKEVSYNNLVD
ncbi:MAG: bifunctional phosphoribosylaminoimidazolecarboxamide formyltransferase/IMP cyclohydrolase PurH, partial [Cyclobacteriaceae bacterium]|nr:bifunctional phosphoribosylaminoimidazolecarboxamide formyltransferase/IMP cyclohydrolase PurH [Cyclobacteriaceae bacterium]